MIICTKHSDLLEKVQKREVVSLTYRDRRGTEKTVTGSVEEIIKDRNKLLYLSTSFEGLDYDVQSDIVSMKSAVFSTQNMPQSSRVI